APIPGPARLRRDPTGQPTRAIGRVKAPGAMSAISAPLDVLRIAVSGWRRATRGPHINDAGSNSRRPVTRGLGLLFTPIARSLGSTPDPNPVTILQIKSRFQSRSYEPMRNIR